MGKLKIVGYELRDIAVMQAPVSFANHRGEVDPFIEICGRQVYPIFVAPMASVTDQNNYKIWIENKLTPVVPRSVQYDEKENPTGLTFEERMEIAKETFVSISLNEALKDIYDWAVTQLNSHNPQDYLGKDPNVKYYICIDIAHGTLNEMYRAAKGLKHYSNVVLMAGNVATPNAYSFYADAGIDYMRVSVGSGSRCTSACNVAVHYPMASLLDQLNEERKAYAHSHNGNAPTKIIADGGINWFDDIQKALALGADAVMCGKIFAECEEACEPIYYARSINDALDVKNRLCGERFNTIVEHSSFYIDAETQQPVKTSICNLKPFRDYYGMSSKRAQKQISDDKTKLKTSEGIDKPVEVKYPVAKWVDNMQSYLRSCMTYTNSHTIKELRENAQVIILGGSGDAAYRK